MQQKNRMIKLSLLSINIFCVISAIPLEPEKAITKTKRSAEFIFAGNHQNGERVKKVGPIPAKPPNIDDYIDENDKEDITNNNLYSNSDDTPPVIDDLNANEEGQLNLLRDFLLKHELEKEYKTTDVQTEPKDEDSIDINDVLEENNNQPENVDTTNETDSNSDVEKNDDSENIVDEIENESHEDDKKTSNEAEIIDESQNKENNDYFLNIPGLRSPYKDYPPVAYPLSYAGIPVKKRSVHMANDFNNDELVYSKNNDENEQRSYRIKRDLYDEDMTGFQALPNSFYLQKRFDNVDLPYYQQMPYDNIDDEIELEEAALMEEAAEKAAKEEAYKRSQLMERMLLEKRLESENIHSNVPRNKENYEMISYNGKIGVFIPIENENENPEYSFLNEKQNKRAQFYPSDGDRRYDALIQNELNKRNEKDAYERIYRLAASLRDI